MGSLPSTSSRMIQTLDFSRFIHGSPFEQRYFGTELVEALSTVGFVKFTNHGISQEQVSGVFQWVRIGVE